MLILTGIRRRLAMRVSSNSQIASRLRYVAADDLGGMSLQKRLAVLRMREHGRGLRRLPREWRI